MKSYGMTDVGKKRKVNQDYLFYTDEPVGCFPNLYIVADGMGGHKAGDKASSVAVGKFVELAQTIESEQHPFLNMEKIIEQVNKEVYQVANSDEAYEGMGTTFVAATVLDDGTAIIMNIGDSRLYVMQEELKQITLDHSLVEELVRAGALSPKLSRNHPQKNIITRAIGVSEEVTPDLFMHTLREGDQILLCSDGLSNMVEDKEIQQILTNEKSLEDEVKQCIEEALFYGATDNVTVLIAQYGDRGCE